MMQEHALLYDGGENEEHWRWRLKGIWNLTRLINLMTSKQPNSDAVKTSMYMVQTTREQKERIRQNS